MDKFSPEILPKFFFPKFKEINIKVEINILHVPQLT